MDNRGVQINKLIKGTFGTDIGMKLIQHLKKTFVDRPIYIKGHTQDETAFREGQRDIVMQIMKELDYGN